MSCSASRFASALTIAGLLLIAGCARKQGPGIQRLAVLRFENLGPDSSTDWMGRAFSEVLATELASAPNTYSISSSRLHSLGQALGVRPISAPGISAEAPLATAAGANRLVYGTFTVQSGRIHVRMTVEDPQTRRERSFEATAADPDVATAATALARQLWPQAPAYSAHNPAALRAYAQAVEAGAPDAALQAARQAIADDPDFGAPYLLIAQVYAEQHDRAALTDTLQQANSRGTALPQTDRARLETIAAGLTGDIAGRQRALDLLARLTPYDPGVWRSAAEIANLRHQYPQAVQAYERALTVEPEDAASWNELAYAAASAGNLPTAVAALRRYEALRPGDPNPVDSLGDVNFMLGRFKDAEQFYLQAAKMAPAFLNGIDQFKAALARLMTGDVTGADALYQPYKAADIHRAEWLWLSGRRKEGYSMLSGQAAGLPSRDAQSVAYAELAIWALMLDNGQAAAMAQKAVETATPASAGVAALARFLVSPPLAPAAWEARAQQFFPQTDSSGSRDLALGYAFLLAKQFAPAVAPLRRAYDRAPSAPESSIGTDLGWALAETGSVQDAAAMLRTVPTPPRAGPGPMMAFWFPQVFRARALVAEKQGKGDEARANQALFEKLAH